MAKPAAGKRKREKSTGKGKKTQASRKTRKIQTKGVLMRMAQKTLFDAPKQSKKAKPMIIARKTGDDTIMIQEKAENVANKAKKALKIEFNKLTSEYLKAYSEYKRQVNRLGVGVVKESGLVIPAGGLRTAEQYKAATAFLKKIRSGRREAGEVYSVVENDADIRMMAEPNSNVIDPQVRESAYHFNLEGEHLNIAISTQEAIDLKATEILNSIAGIKAIQNPQEIDFKDLSTKIATLNTLMKGENNQLYFNAKIGITSISSALGALHEKSVALNERVNEYVNFLQDAIKAKDDKEKERFSLENKYNSIQREIEGLRKKINEKDEDFTKRKSELEAQGDNLRHQYEEQTAEYNKALQILKNANEAVDAISRERDDIAEQKNKVWNDYNVLLTKVKTNENKLNEYKELSTGLESKLAAVQKELDEIRPLLKKRTEDLEAALLDKENLKVENITLQGKIRELEDQSTSLQKTIAENTAYIETLKKSIESEREQYSREIASLQKRLDDGAKIKKEKIKQETDERIENLRREIDSLKMENISLRSQLDDVNKTLKQNVVESQKYLDETTKLKEELTTAKQSNENAIEALSQISGEKNEQTQALRDLSEQYEKLKGQFTDLQQQQIEQSAQLAKQNEITIGELQQKLDNAIREKDEAIAREKQTLQDMKDLREKSEVALKDYNQVLNLLELDHLSSETIQRERISLQQKVIDADERARAGYAAANKAISERENDLKKYNEELAGLKLRLVEAQNAIQAERQIKQNLEARVNENRRAIVACIEAASGSNVGSLVVPENQTDAYRAVQAEQAIQEIAAAVPRAVTHQAAVHLIGVQNKDPGMVLDAPNEEAPRLNEPFHYAVNNRDTYLASKKVWEGLGLQELKTGTKQPKRLLNTSMGYIFSNAPDWNLQPNDGIAAFWANYYARSSPSI